MSRSNSERVTTGYGVLMNFQEEYANDSLEEDGTDIVTDIMHALKDDNPKFDAEVFMQRCLSHVSAEQDEEEQ